MRYIFGLIMSWFPLIILAQVSEFDRNLFQAEERFRNGKQESAEPYLLNCYKMDSSHVPVLRMLFDLSLNQRKWKRVLKLSQSLQRKLPEEKQTMQYFELQSYFYLNAFEKAEAKNKFYGSLKDLDAKLKIEYVKLLRDLSYAKNAYAHPVPFKPNNLGNLVNSKFADYLPNLTQDGKYLIFTRYLSLSRQFPSLQEDFYISRKENGQWEKAKGLSRKINTKRNEGAPSISADGKRLYYAACNRADSKGSCDIYMSYNRGTFWTSPKNISTINSEFWDSQPNVSADGNTLYFVSNRPGGVGQLDLWAVDIHEDDQYGTPYNLGEEINTIEDELSPFMHFDMQTLYFSSNGRPGMGNTDVFVSRKNEGGHWSEPENLGYPINSSRADNSFFVAADGRSAYFSSNRKGGYGQEDIYQFDLYPKMRAQKTGYFKAMVLDSLTQKPISVCYSISNLNDSILLNAKKAKDGQIAMSLKAGQEYVISVYADGYLYYSSTIESVIEDSLGVLEEQIYLKPLAIDQVFELKNIEFDFDKDLLKYKSQKELDILAEYLLSHPNIRILIEGHTDNKGDDAYNLKLSKERSEAVKFFLEQKGIDPERMQTEGFGASRILSNEEHLQDRNRRVMIRIVDLE